MYSLLGVQSVSNVIGVIEIATAALMALRPFSPKASFAGSLAVVTFLLTVSFLFSTPGAAQLKYGFPILGDAGQFLIKDLVLLGASLWTAARRNARFSAHRTVETCREKSHYVSWYGESEAFAASALRQDKRVQPNHVTIEIYQRSSTGARIDWSVSLYVDHGLVRRAETQRQRVP